MSSIRRMKVRFIGADGTEHELVGTAYRTHVTERGERSALTLYDTQFGSDPLRTVYVPWERIVLVTDEGSAA